VIRFELNVYVDGSHSTWIKRIECLFHGHDWTTFYRVPKHGEQGEQWTGCERCRKRKEKR
jgi:hypothetical protein